MRSVSLQGLFWWFGYVVSFRVGASRPLLLLPITSLMFRTLVPSKVKAFVPSISRRQRSVTVALSKRYLALNASHQLQTSILPATSAVNTSIRGTASASLMEHSNNRNETAETSPSSDPIPPPDCTVIAFATTDRTGTGIGLSLVQRDNPDHQPKDTKGTTQQDNIGVYFEQQRTLYEKEYTVLIVALEWIHQIYPGRSLTPTKSKKPYVTAVCIRDEIVYHQIKGIYPIQKDSLKYLHRKAKDLMDSCACEIRLEFTPTAGVYKQSQETASRVLLMEQSDKHVYDFEDPLVMALKPFEEGLVERPTDDPVTLAEEKDSSHNEPPRWTNDEDEFEVEEYTVDSPASATDENILKEVTETKSIGHDTKHRNRSTEINPEQKYLLRFDGACRGNPGEASCGMVLFDSNSNVVWKGAKYLGPRMTNNQAEYRGALTGLQHAGALGVRKLLCEGDSELVIHQLKGICKVKNDCLRLLYQSSTKAMEAFEQVEWAHIVRANNKDADALANLALDGRSSFGLIIDDQGRTLDRASRRPVPTPTRGKVQPQWGPANTTHPT